MKKGREQKLQALAKHSKDALKKDVFQFIRERASILHVRQEHLLKLKLHQKPENQIDNLYHNNQNVSVRLVSVGDQDQHAPTKSSKVYNIAILN